MASKTGHVHKMDVISYSKGTDPEYPSPVVIFGCTSGICSKTNVVKVADKIPPGATSGVEYLTKRTKSVPEGLTQEQVDELKAGKHWPEIASAWS